MKVDLKSLGTFNRLAHDGAEQATRSMSRMTGIDASVDVTRVSLVDRADAGEELGDDTFVGVSFDFEGVLSGEAVLVFEEGSAERIADSLVPEHREDGSMARSSVEEIGNLMMSGFIDGWADYLDASIDHTPPTYVERDGADVLPEAPAASPRDQIFVFRSDIEWVDQSVSFYIYMLPEYEALASLLGEHADEEGDAISLEKLELFNQMTRRGTEEAADNVEMMTGIETAAEVSQISFAPIEDVPKQIGNDTFVGTVVEFTGIPSGYLLVLFDEASARTIAEALLPMEVDADGLTEQHATAIEELGNIMTSGFVDGWANVLQRNIDHNPPEFVHDMGRAILDPLAAQLGQHQRHAFIIDSQMQIEEVEFGAKIHALPNERELQAALDDMLVERAEGGVGSAEIDEF